MRSVVWSAVRAGVMLERVGASGRDRGQVRGSALSWKDEEISP